MRKKQYYYVRLYQVLEWVGYIKEGTIISEITDEFDEMPQVKSCEFNQVETIIIEKVSPFHVKEIITGMVIPIVNIELRYWYITPIYHIPRQMYESHTFVLSKSDKLIAKEVTSIKEVDKYYHLHADSNEFKHKLLTIFNMGENFKNNKKQSPKRRVKK